MTNVFAIPHHEQVVFCQDHHSGLKAIIGVYSTALGPALGGTRFGEPELEASKDMKVVTRIGVGFDAVDVPAQLGRHVIGQQLQRHDLENR